MDKDARLYDLVSSLAVNNGVKATDLFKEMLDERITSGIRNLTHNTVIIPVSEEA